MSVNKDIKRTSRLVRKRRVRKQIQGSDLKPRLCVYRSLRHTYAQLISDQSGRTLLTVSTKALSLPEKQARSVAGAKMLGEKIAVLAKEKNIEDVVFDRNGYLYHGRVQAVAEGAREKGLRF